jgi:hypothetical protein
MRHLCGWVLAPAIRNTFLPKTGKVNTRLTLPA